MTNLEWINEQIEECKKIIESLKIRIIEDSKYPSLVKSHNERIEELKPILQHLESIKAKLEAWEVIRGNLVLDDETSKVRLSVCYRTKNYNKIKNAMEVYKNGKL